jgi:tripartite-type tricarboxylate transporter receptor subunit TctC
MAAAAVGALVGLPSRAQNFPGRQITMVLPSAPGAPSDLVGRLVAKSLSAQAGVPVIPDNRAGANGVIGVQAVLNAPADGHTVLFTTMSTMAVNKALIKGLPYEPMKDLITLGVGYRTWLYVGISSKLPFKTMQELVAFAKREPGKLNYGYGTSTPQMAGKLLEQEAGVQFTYIPYKSHPMAVQGLVTGEVDLMIADPVSFGSFPKSGQIRLLAATSPSRMPGFADIPTLAESGVPDSELGSAHLVMVKAGTPADIVGKLTEWLKGAGKSSELQSFLGANSLDGFLVTGTEATQYLAREIERWGSIARTAGLQPS